MKVAVLMGGTVGERNVSLSTGAEVARGLRRAGHEVVAVDTARGVVDLAEEARILEEKVHRRQPTEAELDGLDASHTVAIVQDPALADVDVFFLALHGGAGENGTVQALLDVAGVAYTGSDRVGCTLAMDKEVTKRLLREAGVPTAPWLTGTPPADRIEEELGLPVVVKAASEGSSLRLILAHDRSELDAALEEARGWHDDIPLIEAYTPGRELTVGVLDGEALPPGEIIPEHEMFDYACKYETGMAQEIFPADLPADVEERVRARAVQVHELLRLRDYSRVDFMLAADGTPYCLEANTLPGLTSNSLFPQAARAAGIEFPDLCSRLAALAAARRPRVPA